MKIKLFCFLMMLYLVYGCGDESVLPPTQILDIMSPSQPVVTAPPADVFEIAMGEQRETTMRIMRIWYTSDAADLPVESPEELERIREGIEIKLDGIAIEDFDLLALQKEFYTKYIDAGGIAIVANADVSDKDLIQARHAVLTMTSKRPELRDPLKIDHGFYLTLIGPATWPSEIPEILPLNIPERFGEDLPHGRCHLSLASDLTGVRGLCYAPITYAIIYVEPDEPCPPDSCRCWNDYCYTIWDGPRIHIYLETFVHEFGHALEDAIRVLDPDFHDRLETAYVSAKELGTWAGLYAETNPTEYWAEGCTWWFYGKVSGDVQITRQELAERDPLLAELLSEWFPPVSLPWHY